MKKLMALLFITLLPFKSFAIYQEVLAYCSLDSLQISIDGKIAKGLWVSVANDSYLNDQGTEALNPLVEIYDDKDQLLWSKNFSRTSIKYQRSGRIKSVTIKKKDSIRIELKLNPNKIISRLQIFHTETKGVTAKCYL